MSKYDRGEFSRFNRDQLLDYIEQQNEQLSRFETRFRDVVRAYRGVLNEKEALETTLKALSVQQEASVTTDLEDSRDRDEAGKDQLTSTDPQDGKDEEAEQEDSHPQEQDVGITSESDTEVVQPSDKQSSVGVVTDSGDESTMAAVSGETLDTRDLGRSIFSPHPPPSSSSPHPSPSTHPSIAQLKQQLVTLTTAMATLTEEKSKMESNFQKDKKAVLSQQEVVTRQLQTERDGLKTELLQCQSQMHEVQDSLRKEQQQRSEDQRSHGDMLKELQTLIARERDSQSTCKTKLRERELELEKLRKQVSEDRTKEYEDHLKIMNVEMEQLRSRLAQAEKKAREPSSQLLEFQAKTAAMKEEHSRSMAAEERRANDAELRLRVQAEREEVKVASLEAKLSDISRSVGNYDKQRENNQASIQKLKDRISQLDSENTALTKAQLERQGAMTDEVNSQVVALQEKLSRMKALLRVATVKANEKTTLPTNIEELSVNDYSELLSSQPSRKECEQELLQLKDEFEKYKTRAQSVLRSRGGKQDSDTVPHEGLKKLSSSNQDLRKEVSRLQGRLEEEEERSLVQTRKLREEMRMLHSKHKQQLASIETTHKNKLQEIHGQMSGTRERSLKLISERDTEIHRLRAELGVVSLSSVPSTPFLQRSFSRSYSSGSQSTGLTEEEAGDNHSWQPIATPPNVSTTVAAATISTTTTTTTTTTTATTSETQESKLEILPEGPDEVLDSSDDVTANLVSSHLPLKRLPIGSASDAVRELLDQPSPHQVHSGGVSDDVKLLHYAQEQQRKREEVALARRKVFQMEDTIRDLQEREQCQLEQTTFLKEEIRKLQRDRSRETENLEYLKNIIIHYMSVDSAGREQLFSPIAAVLHFSKKEVDMIKKSIAARRWLSTPK